MVNLRTLPKRISQLWPLILPLILFLRHPTGFPYPGTDALYSDMSISHYPNMLFLKRALLESGTIPLWSPGILSGFPFAANPLSGLWYPPGWVALLFPLPLGLNVVAGLHLLLGGLGLYFLIREEGLSHRASLFGALAFECTPKLFAHYGAGHLTLLYAISWTPWLLLTARRAVPGYGLRYVNASILLAAICLADPRWVVFAGILWVVYVLTHSHIIDIQDTSDQKNSTLLNVWENFKFSTSLLINRLLRITPTVVSAVLLACPLLVPLVEYTHLSTRADLTLEEQLEFSLPPDRLLGLLVPDFGGNQEFMVYLGGVVLVLVVISVLKSRKNQGERFWLWTGIFALIYALGSNFPLIPYLSQILGLNFLRVPSRSFFVASMAFAVLSAHSVDSLILGNTDERKRRISLVLAGLVVMMVTLAGGVWYLTREFPFNFWYGTGIILATALLIGWRMRDQIPARRWYMVLIGFALLDWGWFDSTVLSFKYRDEVLSEQIFVAQYLSAQDGAFRIYSPSYSLPQQVAMFNGLELADGVDPLQISTYADFMEKATGIPRRGYSVTIPPFNSGDPSTDNVNYQPSAEELGFLNVRFVVSEFDLPVEGLEIRVIFGETRIYENMLAKPRAWVQTEDADVGAMIKPVRVIYHQPNQMKLSASGPGMLVVSEVAYPGWQVKVDGEPDRLVVVGGILRGVILPGGVHDVTLTYHPTSVYLGLTGFFAGTLMVVVMRRIERKKTHS